MVRMCSNAKSHSSCPTTLFRGHDTVRATQTSAMSLALMLTKVGKIYKHLFWAALRFTIPDALDGGVLPVARGSPTPPHLKSCSCPAGFVNSQHVCGELFAEQEQDSSEETFCREDRPSLLQAGGIPEPLPTPVLPCSSCAPARPPAWAYEGGHRASHL